MKNSFPLKYIKMKKIILFAVLTIPVMAGIIFTGYLSSIQKQKAAQTKNVFTDPVLASAQEDSNITTQTAAIPEEWKTFRSESELKVRENEKRITELNLKLNKPGEKSDPLYKNKVAILGLQNNDMKARLEAYEKIQSDWATFKREFNHDMFAVEETLKDLMVD
jgi:hypothetical protein